MAIIEKVLIANRGEIALRITRTLRSMGIETVAVYSDADRRSPHLRAADEAVHIGAAPSRESYLSIEKLIAAARRTGAGAIHPGYGFLSENADFAQAVVDAGLVFIGPPPSAIRAMGSKREAKRIAADAGVPVIPGHALDDPHMAFPVLIKASAGGGGKGMRIVRERAGLDSAIESARREAKSAFGDDTLLIERYVDDPRHVEIQILGDSAGNVVHLFERECSIQRRHQKIIEETPSPALDARLRERMGQAAVQVAKAIGYTNAGTVEFVLAPGGEFYFLEVNTRLQVEHPVTELVTGLDLVREQVRIAEGRPLPFTQADLRQNGAAIECRIYAEDPETAFLPASGRLVDWHLPGGLDVRLDSGVESGSEIGIHYDPMLAKLAAWGPSRPEAIRKLRHALAQLSAKGIKTNVRLLIGVLGHSEFIAGKTDTHFLDRHLAGILAAPPYAPDPERDRVAAIAVTLASKLHREARAVLPSIPSGYRNNRGSEQWQDFENQPTVRYVDLGRGDVRVRVGDSEPEVVRGVSWDPPEVRFEDRGVARRVRVIAEGATFYCHSSLGASDLRARPRFPERRPHTAAGGCTAPMPGKVVAVEVREGDRVSKGKVLVVLEAMKMEHAVRAPGDGLVERIQVSVGQQVAGDAVLVVLRD